MSKDLRFTAVTACLFLTACSTVHKLDPVAPVTRKGADNYDIELCGTFQNWGGHNLPLPFPMRYRSTNWLYVQRLEGVIPATEVIHSYERGILPAPFVVSNFQGALTFTNHMMFLNLMGPSFRGRANKVVGHTRYRFNGT